MLQCTCENTLDGTQCFYYFVNPVFSRTQQPGELSRKTCAKDHLTTDVNRNGRTMPDCVEPKNLNTLKTNAQVALNESNHY